MDVDLDVDMDMDMERIRAARAARMQKKQKEKKKLAIDLDRVRSVARPEQLEESSQEIGLITGQELLQEASDLFALNVEDDPILKQMGSPTKKNQNSQQQPTSSSNSSPQSTSTAEPVPNAKTGQVFSPILTSQNNKQRAKVKVSTQPKSQANCSSTTTIRPQTQKQHMPSTVTKPALQTAMNTNLNPSNGHKLNENESETEEEGEVSEKQTPKKPLPKTSRMVSHSTPAHPSQRLTRTTPAR